MWYCSHWVREVEAGFFRSVTDRVNLWSLSPAVLPGIRLLYSTPPRKSETDRDGLTDRPDPTPPRAIIVPSTGGSQGEVKESAVPVPRVSDPRIH